MWYFSGLLQLAAAVLWLLECTAPCESYTLRAWSDDLVVCNVATFWLVAGLSDARLKNTYPAFSYHHHTSELSENNHSMISKCSGVYRCYTQ